LLLPTTVIYMPLVVPLVVPNARVNAGAIAMPLFLTMLVPLGLGLWVKERSPSWAEGLQPIMGKTSSVALVVLVTATFLGNFQGIRNLFGTGAILAVMLVIGGAFLIGYALGGRDPEIRGVLGLGTAQRNIAAATVVATQGFDDSSILVMVVASSMVALAILFPIARILRQRLAGRAGTDAGG
jgi:BASS family bile acid:Na+ symporter